MVALWVDQYLLFFRIYMCKIEFDAVVPVKPLFYKHYVDDIYVHMILMIFSILQKLHIWEKSVCQVMAKNALDQSDFSTIIVNISLMD